MLAALLLAKVIVSILLQREFTVVVATLLPEMAWDTADVASSLLGLEASLAVASCLLSADDLHDNLRLSRGELAVLGNHPLFDSVVGVWEEGSGAQVKEIRLNAAEDRVVEVRHEIQDLRLLRQLDPDRLAGRDLIVELGNPAIKIS